MQTPDLVVVGSGFFGATIANLAAGKLGLSVLVLEKRAHVGGNAYSERDPVTGIHVHKYGSHIFHTNQEETWKYIHNFTTINNYRHRVKAIHAGQYFDFPINLSTISQFFKENYSPKTASELFAKFNKIYPDPQNLEEKAISMIGPELYEAFIKNYTRKQWQVDPRNLPASTIARIPTRTNFNADYFDDRYQGIPIHGYTEWIINMLSHEKISVQLETDFLKVRASIGHSSLVVYTGPIDQYFKFEFGHLGWRTLDFETETHNVSDFQGAAVVNYPDLDVSYTRVHEFKHLNPTETIDKTIVMKEFSRVAQIHDEPYYPINALDDRVKLSKYRKLAEKERSVLFGGRLGSYQYLDMHMAIASARSMFQNQIRPKYD